MDLQESSPLRKLPPELLLEINECLDASALCSLRLSCKFHCACTLHHFGKTYLNTIQSDLSLLSLQRMEYLTRNPRLCPYVHSLDIIGGNRDTLGIGLSWKRPASGLRLFLAQKPFQRLQNIILRLENCRSFRLHKHSWGSWTGPLSPFHGITIILSIVAGLERPLRELSILFKPLTSLCYTGIGQAMMTISRVDKALLQDPKLIAACSTLEKFTFRQAVNTPDSVDFVMQIIQHATRLQRLSIDADCANFSDILMSRLYSDQTVRALKLRELRLKDIRAGSSEALNDFIASFKHSLTSISLAGIHLSSGTWPSLLRALAEFLPTRTQFSTLYAGGWICFLLMRQDPLIPSHVHIVIDPARGIKVPFSVSLLCGSWGISRLTYSGPRADIALNALADGAPFVPGKG
ncbi:hypothetical protein BDW69DRAFT_200180 [Aspergillus filifer]